MSYDHRVAAWTPQGCVQAFCISLGLLLLTPGAGAAEGLVADDAKVERLADGFKFTEGPACDAQGNVYFSDIPNDSIHKWSTDGQLSTFSETSGGSNGLYFDGAGHLIGCQGKARQLGIFDSEGMAKPLADRYEGKRFNSPNDLWIDPRGGIYFTDPRYGAMDGLELDGFHVYYLDPKRTRVIRVTDDLVKPNGLIGTADGKKLYIADAGAGKTYVYTPKRDGTLSDKRLFVEQGSDGMTLDAQGNLYLTSRAVKVYDPQGKHLEDIAVGESPANVCFGGKDRRTLFITARTGFYAVPMRVRGQ